MLKYLSVIEYYIGSFISSFVIKACIVKESFPVRARNGLAQIVDAYVSRPIQTIQSPIATLGSNCELNLMWE